MELLGRTSVATPRPNVGYWHFRGRQSRAVQVTGFYEYTP